VFRAVLIELDELDLTWQRAAYASQDEARDRLWLAESLVDQRRRAEADVQLQEVLACYRSVGATRYVRAGESLLAASA
jgi:hypothetical protein